VLAHPDAALLELRRIAPTVAVSPLPLVQVLEGLRAAGFSPAAEDTGGAVLDLTDRGRRINPRRRSGGGLPPEPDAKQRAALVSRLRAGEVMADARRGRSGLEPANGSTLDLLRTAAASGRNVWIGFVDGHGVAGERVLEPVSVGGGVVEGRDAVDGAVHRVPLHRITSIAVVDD
jgi:hypothetical protein